MLRNFVIPWNTKVPRIRKQVEQCFRPRFEVDCLFMFLCKSSSAVCCFVLHLDLMIFFYVEMEHCLFSLLRKMLETGTMISKF